MCRQIVVLTILVLAGVRFGHGQETTLKPRIYYLHIRSDVKFRFSTTLITSKVINPSTVAQETTFHVTLPDEAFITNFQMKIDGRLYPGQIDEKTSADTKYQRSKSKGQSAGQVRHRPRETNKFQVDVNIAGLNSVTFNLTYQNLLRRNHGTYEHVIYIDPGQVVDDLRIDVAIQESRAITYIKVPPLRNDTIEDFTEGARNELVSIDRPTRETARIHYYPSAVDQRRASARGLSGLFSVEYDIDRNFDAGDVLVVNGFFVHYFAPTGMDPIPKDILFVLDTSSSMFGTKIAQLRDAMHIILNDLHEADRFNIIKFSTTTTFWRPGKVISATRQNIAEAEGYVTTMTSAGWTNINEAMTYGIDFLNSIGDDTGRVKLMVFLTDGSPTKGEENTDIILENVKTRNIRHIAIFTLAFGEDADYEFVKKVALQNDGVARKIYEESDAVLQISGFYAEISRAALKNVTFRYLNSSTNLQNVTKNSFNSFFSDSELVVAGRIKNTDMKRLSLSVEGNGVQGDISLALSASILDHSTPELFPSLTRPEDFEKITERIWAYVTIKQLLDEAVGELNSTAVQRENVRQKIIAMSMKYHFVTPLTSLVVIKPDQREVGNLQEGEDAELARDMPSPTPDPFPGYAWRGRRPGALLTGEGKSTAGGGGGDPHFMIRVQGLSHPVCFDMIAEPGNILRLLKDPNKGFIVNTLIIPGMKTRKDGRMRTYFGRVAMLLHNITITIDPANINVGKHSLSWDNERPFYTHNLHLHISTDDTDTRVLHVDVRDSITISIKRHLAVDSTQVNYLNVYLDKEEGLSRQAEGVLGQLHHKKIKIKDIILNKRGEKIGKLIVQEGRSRSKVRTRLKERHDVIDKHVEKCWTAHTKIQGLLTGTYFCNRLYDP
ncbi:inter-alpha-trypsin inhibitor heavy chain H3-like isoform X2 [Mizuhopecten yessoensis]|uniref:Inter-alpha-trypsin inhibitor heavy chain H3 n=1 Tax=Mizuhopecten yessoensis TaxID=6573 RepID=A0A210R4B7_MIZYE|nr:inter-alpha-trypsin inhibitor heavy chain H3-like isoform X2 [Mizuhopecten yessoensis]OWF55795.1 Inter-alpha-trypsin inhibitor heavy chain H3 [Mizuhopecten yessoensis]